MPGLRVAKLADGRRRRRPRRRRGGRRGRRWSPRRAPGRMASTASATRRGSSSSNQVGLPVLMAQKPQARVHMSPRIMTWRCAGPSTPRCSGRGLLADRVEVQAAQQALEVVVVVARRHPRLDPVGVAAQGRRADRRRRLDQPAAAHGDRDRPARSRGRGPGPGSKTGSSRAIGLVDAVSGPTASSQALMSRRSAAPAGAVVGAVVDGQDHVHDRAGSR